MMYFDVFAEKTFIGTYDLHDFRLFLNTYSQGILEAINLNVVSKRDYGVCRSDDEIYYGIIPYDPFDELHARTGYRSPHPDVMDRFLVERKMKRVLKGKETIDHAIVTLSSQGCSMANIAYGLGVPVKHVKKLVN